jgi:hypothetical protein
MCFSVAVDLPSWLATKLLVPPLVSREQIAAIRRQVDTVLPAEKIVPTISDGLWS